MKIASLLLGACLVAGTMASLSAPAAARDRHHGGSHVSVTIGWSNGYGFSSRHHGRYERHHRPYFAPRRHYRGHGRHYRDRRHHAPRYYGHSRRHYSYTDGYRAGPRYRSHVPSAAACHPVFRFGIWHGRPAKAGGTMCYNAYGNGYVVSGSRYLIHYR